MNIRSNVKRSHVLKRDNSLWDVHSGVFSFVFFFGFFYIVSYIVYYNYVYVEDILRNYNHYLMVLYMLIHSLLAKKNNY